MLAWVLLVCQVRINSFKMEDWFRNYLNDCKVNLRLTLIDSRHVGFLKSDETYAMISNIGSRSRFNFYMLYPKIVKIKKLKFCLSLIWNLKVGSILDWSNI